MNEQNLRSFGELDPEELKAISQKGGRSSGSKRRERKQLREELMLLLAEGDTQKRLCLSLIDRACKGDPVAFRVIRDSIGEAPEQLIGLYNAQDDLPIRTDPDLQDEIRDLYLCSVETGRFRKLADRLLPHLEDRMKLIEQSVNEA